MAKFTFTLLAVSIFTMAAHAQGGPDACSWAISHKNTGCWSLSPGSCSINNGCSSTTFTVPCNDTYTISAQTYCSSSDCENCAACVQISHSGGSYPWCSTLEECGTGDCNDLCTAVLHTGITYTLTVCLMPCGDGSCDDCGNTCQAVGCVYLNSACPAP